jgi:hypothetical protein
MSNFGLAWLGSGWNLSNVWPAIQCQEDMICSKTATYSLPSMVTSLIGPIWRKWNGPAVVSLVCWLQTTLVLAWLCVKSAKCLASDTVAKRTWHVQKQPHIAS